MYLLIFASGNWLTEEMRFPDLRTETPEVLKTSGTILEEEHNRGPDAQRARARAAAHSAVTMQTTALSVAAGRPLAAKRRATVRCGAGPASPPPEPSRLWDIAAAKGKQKQVTVAAIPPPPPPPTIAPWQTTAIAGAGIVAAGVGAKLLFGEKPYRAYTPESVGREYDAWTEEGILEYYWVRRLPGSTATCSRCSMQL